MSEFKAAWFSCIYKDLLYKIQSQGIVHTNERTGVRVKTLPGAYAFQVDLDHGVPIAGDRKLFPHIAAAENAWQLLGTKDATFISKYAKIWDKFTDTSGKIECAYGYRWLIHFDRNQLGRAMRTLRKDPSNRQIYISAWDPRRDGLGDPDQPKNIPCPVGFSLNVVKDKLNCSVFMRSSDVYVGLPYDVMTYAFMIDAISLEIGYRPGKLSFMLANAHIYEPQWEAMDKSISGDVVHSNWIDPDLQFPLWNVDELKDNPDLYVKQVKRMWQRIEYRQTWDPKPEVVE